jgi:hypothetical protein
VNDGRQTIGHGGAALKRRYVPSVLAPAWSEADEILGTALCDLIKDMDTIASFAVPYARLPKKLSRYADRFPRWTDLARQTPESLLALPKLGVTAVEALIDAAGEAVRVTREIHEAGPVGADAALTRLLSQLSHYDRTILAGRIWALQPEPLHVVADRLGVSSTSVARNLPRALDRVQELLTEPAHQELVEHAADLRRAIGPCAPASVADLELCRLGIDPDGQIAEFLLHLAGPYARQRHWLQTTEGCGGIRAVLAALTPVADRDHAPTTQDLLNTLTAQGLAAGSAIAFLQEHTDLRCFGDAWVPWPEAGVGNKAQAMMRVLGSPVTVETLDRALRAANTGEISSLANAISSDERFVRTSRHTWALRGWGLEEYDGVVSAIGQRIDAAGGAAPVAAIVAHILAHHPDVAKSSIRTYLGTLAFVVEKGVARRRTDDDEWPAVAPLRTARGCYRNGPNEIRLVMPVDHEMLRGSGRPIPQPVAYAAGVKPGQRRTFTGPGGELTLVWRLSSTTGGSVGSMRTYARAAEAVKGDDLVLILRTDTVSFDVTRIAGDESAWSRLPKLLGREVVDDTSRELAKSLDCSPEEVDDVLRSRGDHELLASLENEVLARR